MVKSCYIHIPFCKRICSYCDFCKLLYSTHYVDKYLDTLKEEIHNYYHGEILDTIYIGGGTPSSLSIDELKKLFSILSILKKSDSCEITMEANFDSITKEKIDLFQKFGGNRISFGLETTHSWILEKMGRSLDLDYVKSIISYCKEIGLDNINIDLMYAFPEETLEDVSSDLSFILSLDVFHISTYSLILEEHTKLYIEGEKNISEDLDYEVYQLICSKLSNYDHYEISNFAKDGYYSKHNFCYWRNEEYYGFGLGASGYIDDVRYSNTRSISHYLQKKFHNLEENLSKYDKMEYEVILNLRTQFGISKDKFFRIYHCHLEDVYDISSLLSDGYLVDDGKSVSIPKKYWYLSNEILVKILEVYRDE